MRPGVKEQVERMVRMSPDIATRTIIDQAEELERLRVRQRVAVDRLCLMAEERQGDGSGMADVLWGLAHVLETGSENDLDAALADEVAS